MKNLLEFINESIITESSADLTVFFNHERPSRVIFVKDIDDEAKNLLNRSVFDVFDVKVRKKGILFCFNNDESFIMTETGCKTMDQLKKKVAKDLDDAISAMTSQNIVDGYDIKFLSLGGRYFSVKELNDIADDDDAVEKAKKLDTKKIASRIVDGLEDTEVDGDSAYAFYFIDLDKGEQVGGSSYMTIRFYTSADVKEMFEE